MKKKNKAQYPIGTSMKVGNQKQPFISFICYEGSRYSAIGTWYLQWISMLREFIGCNWKKPRSTYFIHRDRRLICCWNRSKIATVMKQKTRIPLPKKRSPLLSLTQPMLWIGVTGVGFSPLSIPLLCPLLWVAGGYPRQCVASVHSEHEILTCIPHKDIR